MNDLLEAVDEKEVGMIPDGKTMPWQMNIIKGQPQTIKCPNKKGILCTLTIPSTACITCEHYIVMKKGPGAL